MQTPDNYICKYCGKKGVKLWRLYNTFLNRQILSCAKCSCINQGKKYNVDKDGLVESILGGKKIDQIGWLVPAIPHNDTYWGYSSIPDEDIQWWKSLPNE